jgi:hypothetical protein
MVLLLFLTPKISALPSDPKAPVIDEAEGVAVSSISNCVDDAMG